MLPTVVRSAEPAGTGPVAVRVISQVPSVSNAEVPCVHRGDRLGYVDCKCQGKPVLFGCGCAEIAAGHCLVHAAGKPIRELRFDDGRIEKLDGDAYRKRSLEIVPVCAMCERRTCEPVGGHVDMLHVTHRVRWQDQIRRSGFALHARGLDVSAVEIVKPSAEQLMGKIRECSPRIVLCHGFAFDGLPILASAFPDTTFVMVDHSSLNHTFTWPKYFSQYRAVLEASNRLPNLLVAAVDRLASWDRLGYPRFFTWTNPIYVPADRIAKRIDPPSVMITGRVDWMKALPTQITAAALLQRRGGVRCLVSWNVPGGPQQAGLLEHAAACGLVYELLPYADFDGWYDRLRGQVSVVLQPSMSDSFNIVTAEAALHGRPFVGSATIDHTPGPWAVRNPNDPVEIADVTERILADYERESAAARSIGEALAERNNDRYFRLIRDLLSRTADR